MADELFRLWVYLSSTPLAGLTLTLVAYAIGYAAYARCAFHPLANPVPIAVAVVVGALAATGTPYRTYFEGAQFVHFLLGPAVVGLAVPLAREWESVRRLAVPIAASLAVGSVVAASSAVAIAWALGASPSTLASLVPKSVTAPVAMGIAERIGGLPALAAVLAVATGVIGAVLGRYVFDAAGVRDLRARGFALGLAAHGIGTARAFQVDREAGSYAGLAFGLHALLASLAMPLAVAAWLALAA
ncbi:Inner membrane protein YohK [Burkholderiales bacterium]|nr:Inner membrane protein YohK [Burkholderiales bacterium]